jgi:hypothetical protein
MIGRGVLMSVPRVLCLVCVPLLIAAEPARWTETALPAPAEGYRALRWTPAQGQSPAAGWPVVVWLHGFSLRGDDLTKLKEYGPPAILEQLAAECVLIAPQLSNKQLVWKPDLLDKTVAAALAQVPADAQRRYAIGASLGAAGAFEWVASAPEQFAGLILLAGAGNPNKAKTLARVPVWQFHGATDAQVPLAKARATEAALQAAGCPVRFTELAGVGHDAAALTRAAFGEHQAWKWLLQQKRVAAAAPPLAPAGTPSITELRQQATELKAKLPPLPAPLAVPTNEQLFAWIKGLCATPHRRPGTPEGQQGEAWVAEQFKQLQLQTVTSDRVPIQVWQPTQWSLTVDGQACACFFLLNSGFTPAAGVTAPLLFGGDGQIGQIKAADAKGKIVVVRAKVRYHDQPAVSPRSYFQVPAEPARVAMAGAEFPYNLLGGFLPIKLTDAYERAKAAGAVGVVFLTDELRSQGTSFYWPYDAEMKSLPGLYVGKSDAARVETAAKAGRPATLVQTGSVQPGHMANIWGVLPGQSDDTILITSHHDAAHQGAVEDASGIAQVLAQAWVWSRVPRAQRPYTLVFVAAGGHFYKGQGAYEWAKAHPDLLRKCKAVLTLEHMPAKEVRATATGYEPTGRLQPMTIYTSAHAPVLAGLWHTLEQVPPPMQVSAERSLVSVPLSDAAGYVARSREPAAQYPHRDGVPYISWISAPLYLVDAADTLDKVEPSQLAPVCRTITALVQRLQMLP